LAHELGHWIVHPEIYFGEGVAAASSVKTSMEENPVIERQADILASAFLMPCGPVKRAFHNARGYEDPTAPLASLFQVSKQAMGIFLRDHHLQ